MPSNEIFENGIFCITHINDWSKFFTMLHIMSLFLKDDFELKHSVKSNFAFYLGPTMKKISSDVCITMVLSVIYSNAVISVSSL